MRLDLKLPADTVEAPVVPTGEKHIPEAHGFAGGDAHALAIDRIEAAERVAQDDQAIRMVVRSKYRRMLPGMPKREMSADHLAALDRVEDGLRGEFTGIEHESGKVRRRLLVTPAAQGHDPEPVLDRVDDAGPGVLCGIGMGDRGNQSFGASAGMANKALA